MMKMHAIIQESSPQHVPVNMVKGPTYPTYRSYLSAAAGLDARPTVNRDVTDIARAQSSMRYAMIERIGKSKKCASCAGAV